MYMVLQICYEVYMGRVSICCRIAIAVRFGKKSVIDLWSLTRILSFLAHPDCCVWPIITVWSENVEGEMDN